jgi:hypothetical protein
LSTQADESFDGAICCMGLMNIPDIGACFESVNRVVMPDGWFLICITHPCFQSPHSEWIELGGDVKRACGDYFEEIYWERDGGDELRARVGDYHRTLSTYINTLIANGFSIERVHEPQPDPGSGYATEMPANRAVPALLLVRARKVQVKC